MASFDYSDGKHIFISDDYNHRVSLNPEEALNLLYWLSGHENALYNQVQQHTHQAGGEHVLEIHLYEGDLEHLDELKAAIPELRERKPVARVLGARWDSVTERALQLLKEYQLEYTVHPLLLEDEEAFAQG